MKSKEPVDYQIGWREFLGCHIDLSRRPLIPRDETEFWAELAIKEIKQTLTRQSFKQGLDLFAGSGCLGLAIRKHCPNIEMTFAEKEEKFCEQIKKNIKLNSSDKTRVIQTDLFAKIQGKFDYIFANPPYVPTRRSRLQSSVRDWEPAEALLAGPDGLALIRPFLAQAKDYLTSDGMIYLEFGYGQKGKIDQLLRQNAYRSWQFRRDQFGRWRWVVIQ